MITSYRNVNILINNQKIIANNVELNNSLDIAPVYARTDEITSKTNAESGPKGNLRLSYYLTGLDVLNNYIYTTGSPISGNIAGYYFRSGYLTSYSFNAQPNNPVNVQTELVFFDPLTGVFNPQGQNAIAPEPLDFSNVSITYTSGFLSSDNIIGLDFNYSQDISPVYKSQKIYADQVSYGPKNINIKIISDTNSGLANNINGDPLKLNLNLQDRAGNNKLGFVIDGFIKNRQLSVDDNSYIKTIYDISQYNVNNVTTISGYNPTSGYYYQDVKISGQNVDNIIAVTFNNNVQNDIVYENSYRITAKIPESALSGKMYATYIDGTINYIGLFNVLDSGIQISALTPYTGSYYLTGIQNQITITGRGFNSISQIRFGSGYAEKWDINKDRTAIKVNIPSGAQYDYVKVISSLRQQTGTSSYKFLPIPQILKYEGTARNELKITGLFAGNSTVKIIGRNMSSITGVYTTTNIFFSGVSGANDSFIECYIPSGGVYNVPLSFRLQSGLKFSTSSLTEDVRRIKPIFHISGISGDVNGLFVTGKPFIISGRYFLTELLREDASQYEMQIGDNPIQLVNLLNHHYLSGTLGTGNINDGLIKVFLPLGGGYVSNPNVSMYIHKTPILGGNRFESLTTGRSWPYIYYPEGTYITGKNLEYVTGIKYQCDSLITSPPGIGSTIYTDEWLPLSGWTYSNNKIFLPSTGIQRLLASGILSGWSDYYSNNDFNFCFFYRGGSGSLNSTDTDAFGGEFKFQLAPQREPSSLYLYQHPIKFSGSNSNGTFSDTFGTNGFISGSGVIQRRMCLINNPTHGVSMEYRFSGVSGLNFWSTGSAVSSQLRDGQNTGNANTDIFGYGFQRVYKTFPNFPFGNKYSSFDINIGISGIRNSSSSNYIFDTGIYYFPYTIVATDGLVTGYTGIIYITTGRYY